MSEVKTGEKELQDTQSSKDSRNIRIDKVGVKRLQCPIQVADRANERQNTVASVSMTVDLPRHFKGTHMSRFVEVLNEHGNLFHVENIPDVLRKMQERLESNAAHLEFEFPYFIRKKAPISGSPGLMDYQTKFDAAAYDDEIDFKLSVEVPVTTLCPCSKAISARGAHNQRGYVTLTIQSKETVWIEELIEMVEQSASSELYSLLKRTDEKEVTERAYDNPVFVEDLARNVALKCNQHPKITWYKVEVENLESIHNHSAYAMIEKE